MEFGDKNMAVNRLLSFRKLSFIKVFFTDRKQERIQKEYEFYERIVEMLKNYIKNDYLYKLNLNGKEDFYRELKAHIADWQLYEIPKEQLLEKIAAYNEITRVFRDEIEKINPDHLRSYPGWTPNEKEDELWKNYFGNEIIIEANKYKNDTWLFHPDLINTTNIEDYYTFLENCITLLKTVTDKYFEDNPKGQGKTKKNLTNKNIKLTLADIWSDDKQAEMFTEISKLVEKFIIKSDDQKYSWQGKQWKKMAAITELWKDKQLLKPTYQKFGNQSELCTAVCTYFGIADKQISSIYNIAFKASLISSDGKLIEKMQDIKKQVQLELED